MATSVSTTLSRFGFERRTRSFFWTSRSSAALGEQSGDRASALTSGVGSSRTVGVGYALDEKAVEAVSRWKFTPALKDGQPIEKEISVEVDFHLF